jgi:hypothetical protein
MAYEQRKRRSASLVPLFVAVFVSQTILSSCSLHQAHAFILQSGSSWPERYFLQRPPKPRASASLLTPLLLAAETDFDFSSPAAWDDFYKKLQADKKQIEEDEGLKDDNAEMTPTVYEWHDSIPLPSLAELIPPNSDCLFVGCGNSLLPQAVLDADKNIKMALLDTSETCLDQLKQQYGNHNEISYICGSATDMSKHFPLKDCKVNTIVDKGLTDALMCGEGWPGPLECLLSESSKIFHKTFFWHGKNNNESARYILISYKLMTSTKEFIQETCNKVGNDKVAWKWQFDVENLSSDRVSVSIATIRPFNSNRDGGRWVTIY